MRTELDNKRPCYKETIRDHNGTPYQLTVSFSDGKIKEAWMDGGGKAGTERPDILTEVGRLVSVALQYGIPLEEIRQCATYRSNATPCTVVGVMLDEMLNLENTNQIHRGQSRYRDQTQIPIHPYQLNPHQYQDHVQR